MVEGHKKMSIQQLTGFKACEFRGASNVNLMPVLLTQLGILLRKNFRQRKF